jgi:KUP system potassium uptake protein
MSTTGSGSPAIAAGRSDALPRAGFWTLMIGSIGVVYGDIGTSPLYAIRESVNAASGHTGSFTPDMVLGVLSLIFWSLVIVVTIKYVFFLLYADNKGEGGTLSLMALVQRAVGRSSLAVVVLGIAGAALFYGDAMLTPALSVLSAVEGLKIATPAFEPYIAPLAVLILFALFAVQYHGTAAVSALFGPITSVWFVALAAAGAYHIALNPSVLAALSPAHGLGFLLNHGTIGFVTLGAVFLAVTGAEALYADLGHFGRKPIQVAWLAFVFPALVTNYFGQGALLLATPAALENPFFLLYPEWALYPMVALATAATVIASQAVITGAYSITQQAVQLGLLPRLEVRHTSEKLFGQIYIPRVNWMLLIGVLLLVGLFRSSSSLATAYGIAVTGTMVITALLAFVVLWKVWRWNPVLAGLLVAPFLLIDLTFLSANLAKVWDGGWVSLAVAGALMTVMATWRRGSRVLAEKTRRLEVPLDALVRSLEQRPPHRVPGTAVFLTHDPQSTPTALLHSLKHYHVLHENNVVLTVETADQPRVAEEDSVAIERVGNSFARVTVRYGYMETPQVPKALAIARQLGWQFDIMATSFFLSRRSLRPAAKSAMPRWQDRLFLALARQANDASAYFRIPSERAVEVGMQVAI